MKISNITKDYRPEVVIITDNIATELGQQDALSSNKNVKRAQECGLRLFAILKDTIKREGDLVKVPPEGVERVQTIFRKMNREECTMFPFICPDIFVREKPEYKDLLFRIYLKFLFNKHLLQRLNWLGSLTKNDIPNIPNIAEFVKQKYEGEFSGALAVKFVSQEQILASETLILSERIMQCDAIVERHLQTHEREIRAAERALFLRKNHPVTRLFVTNDAVLENPELDVVYLDKMLCCMGGVFASYIVLSNVENTSENPGEDNSNNLGPIWIEWIKKRIHLLLDPKAETGKLFRHIFSMPFSALIFTPDNHLSEEAKEHLPKMFHETLEKSAQEHIREKTTTKTVTSITPQRICNAIAAPVAPTLQEKIVLTGIQWSEATRQLNFVEGLPTGTKQVEIRIYKSGKVAGFGIYTGTVSTQLSLETDSFINQTISTHKPLLLGQPLLFKAGERYQIGITACLDTGKSDEFLTDSFLIPKTKEEPSKEEPSVVPNIGGKITAIIDTPSTLLNTVPDTPTTQTSAIAEVLEDPKESEVECLQLALEIFLGKSTSELQDFFLEHHLWDEATQTLTLTIPIEALDYIPNEEVLPIDECNPMLQWTARIDQKRWILPAGTPDKIREIIPAIYNHVTQQVQEQKDMTRAQEIGEELGELGLPTSRRSTDVLRREFVNICKRNVIDPARLDAKILELGIRARGFRCFYNATSITLAKKLGTTQQNEWSINYNWGTNTFTTMGLEEDVLFQEMIENALLRFLVLIDEQMIEEILIGKVKKIEGEGLENGLQERLKKGNASFFIRFHGQDIIIPDISEGNYKTKMTEIREKYGQNISIFIVYRTYSYSLYDGELKVGQNRIYDQCIEKHLDVIQARCRATLAQKASFRESLQPGKNTTQERGPFTNGVANHCREFFFRKDPFNPEDMQDFLIFIHAEGTPEEKRALLYMGVRSALFGDTENTNVDPCICRKFFFKKDPNNLDDVADFMAFLQEKGTNQSERPGENHVGIVYNSPVIGPISDIPRILAKEKKEKKKKEKD